jgi:GntR family transcriptional repressor for pyruvate dehydrogenase complex
MPRWPGPLPPGVEHYTRDHFDQVIHEHRSIAAAVADGDEAAAAAAMRSHLANSRRRFKASVRQPADAASSTPDVMP